MSQIENIKSLVKKLNEASYAYYIEDEELISNHEYDKLYDELVELEKNTGIIMSNSPTQQIGFSLASSLETIKHEKPMLSLNKTKNPEELKSWLGEKVGLLGWKKDGLTIVLSFDSGNIVSAVTRGTGEYGENIYNNVKYFQNVPKIIPFKGKLIVRGEAIIRYSDFNKINSLITEIESKYKNPRNLCSGTVRNLNNKVVFDRKVFFSAFTLVSAEGVNFENSKYNQYEWLKTQGFDVVESFLVTKDNIIEKIEWFQKQIETNDEPSDGLVLSFDDIVYSNSLGTTSKFPKDSIAFKWKDEEVETTVTKIEWNPSRTGLINPIAILNPVEIDGTTVSRASLHNVSCVEELKICEKSRVLVYKANMIIPQILENLTPSGVPVIPTHCPSCGGEVSIKISDKEVKTLHCLNLKCPAKQIKTFTHFASRDAMDINGFSEATIEKLINLCILKKLSDIYKIKENQENIIQMEGFGEKSFNNLVNTIEQSRIVPVDRFLYALGIPLVGVSTSKAISKAFNGSFEKIRNAKVCDITSIFGIGDALATELEAFFADKDNAIEVDNLLQYITLTYDSLTSELKKLNNLSFVVTGTLSIMSRGEVEKLIEENGGKILSSVSKKLNYLVCGENAGSKLTKAKDLHINIISENELLKMLQ